MLDLVGAVRKQLLWLLELLSSWSNALFAQKMADGRLLLIVSFVIPQHHEPLKWHHISTINNCKSTYIIDADALVIHYHVVLITRKHTF